MNLGSILLDSLRASVSINAVVYAMAGVGLNLQFGYGGLLNFGLVAFMLAGAYGVGIAVVEFGWSMWIGIPLGILLSVGVGLLFGLPTLRLRADYLAIVTIATGEILRLFVRSGPMQEEVNGVQIGGVFGYDGFANAFFAVNPYPAGNYGFGGFSFNERAMWVLTAGWGLVALLSLVVWILIRSPWGRMLRAVRDDEDAVRSLGKNVFNLKLQTLVLGGVIAAVAGMMQAVDQQAIRPDFFRTVVTFTVYTAVILGGKATILGPIVGSVVLWFLIQFTDGLLKYLVDIGWLNLASDQISGTRFALVGLALVLLVVFRPQGIVGRKEEVLLDA
ncbi:MAG: branched-chain amino acid ABC transporter permease [Acidimicrobiia bacterium]|nr:branched-chain amino acid ABC transporter permease [Acidimicrobiia bacterium]